MEVPLYVESILGPNDQEGGFCDLLYFGTLGIRLSQTEIIKELSC